MPHVIVKLWPGKSEDKKKELAEAISRNLCEILEYQDKSVSISFEEIPSTEWAEKVYQPDIAGKPNELYKKPGYSM